MKTANASRNQRDCARGTDAPCLFSKESKGKRESGYLLVEYLVYMAVLVVVIGIAFSAFYQCLTNSRGLARNSDDIVRTLQAGELWRADVRRAAASPRISSEGGSSTFEIPTTNGLVTYVFANRAIWRTEGETPPREILSRVKDSRLFQDQREKVNSWRWELELWTKKKGVRLKPLFTFQAMPGWAPL